MSWIDLRGGGLAAVFAGGDDVEMNFIMVLK